MTTTKSVVVFEWENATMELLEEIKKDIVKNPNNILNYQDFLQYSIGEKDFNATSELKKLCLDGVKNDLQCAEQLENIYKQALLFEARNLRFESFMEFVEYDRDPSKKFWLARKAELQEQVNDIQDLVDQRLNVLGEALPPGTGKTTLMIFLLAMLIGYYSGKPSIYTGHSNTLTRAAFIGVLDILQNPDYKWNEIYPGRKIITDAKDQTIDLDRKHRFSDITFRSLDGSLTGATRAEVIIIFDDTVTGIEEALSIERLDSKFQKVTSDALSRKKLGCLELWGNTDWSLHDPKNRRQRQLEGDPKARFNKKPALNEQGESNFNYKFGVGFDTKYFTDMKSTLDEATWSALFQQEPIERKGLLYPAEELRRYYDMPDKPINAVAQLGVVDTKTTGEDFYVCWIGYNFGGDDWYIEIPICDNSLDDIVEPRLVSSLRELDPQEVQFESNNAGGKIAENVQSKLREVVNGKKCRTIVTTKWSSLPKEVASKNVSKGMGKITKIIVNASWVKAHCLFRNPRTEQNEKGYAPNSDYDRAMRQMTTFTMSGKNKHDDVVDTAAMFAIKAQSLSGQKIEIIKSRWF